MSIKYNKLQLILERWIFRTTRQLNITMIRPANCKTSKTMVITIEHKLWAVYELF